MKTEVDRRQSPFACRVGPGWSIWWLLIVIFLRGAVCLRAEDMPKDVDPIKPEVPVNVVFLFVGGKESAERSNNTKIVGWTKGLTVPGAILGGGGIPLPPRPKVKVIRGNIEIHLGLRDMMNGEVNVQLEPGDKVVLYPRGST
jgi:hypothetical protein